MSLSLSFNRTINYAEYHCGDTNTAQVFRQQKQSIIVVWLELLKVSLKNEIAVKGFVDSFLKCLLGFCRTMNFILPQHGLRAVFLWTQEEGCELCTIDWQVTFTIPWRDHLLKSKWLLWQFLYLGKFGKTCLPECNYVTWPTIAHVWVSLGSVVFFFKRKKTP